MDDISVGSVVQPDWDGAPHRILLMDQIQVLYDVWWSHAHEWGFTTLSGEGHYYCLPTSLLRGRSIALRSEPLTDIERAIHRPDLPLRLLRSPSMQWSKDQYQNMSHFIAAHQADIEHLGISDDDVALAAPEVFLAPFGPGGRPKRGVRLKAWNGRHFTSIELLWRAYAVQAPQHRTSTNGIGIYRAGFKSKLPVFYLWGSDDRAGHTALAEGRDPLKSGGRPARSSREFAGCRRELRRPPQALAKQSPLFRLDNRLRSRARAIYAGKLRPGGENSAGARRWLD